jgi:phosphoglucosamine mutase
MCEMVRHHDAHIGIALDGDADRVVLCDEHGTVIDGDAVMALCATRMIKENTLAKSTLVATVMSNIGLERAIRDAGGTVVRTQVGDRYVVEEMRKNGYNLGGEQSGHLVFLDHATTGDGIVAALRVLAIMAREGKPLSELATVMTRMPQVLINKAVDKKVPLAQLPDVQRMITDIERQLGADGRVLVRYSGTETKVRVMIEGTDEVQIRGWAEELAGVLAQGCRS